MLGAGETNTDTTEVYAAVSTTGLSKPDQVLEVAQWLRVHPAFAEDGSSASGAYPGQLPIACNSGCRGRHVLVCPLYASVLVSFYRHRATHIYT